VTRAQVLEQLIAACLRGDDEPQWEAIYQALLRKERPTEAELDHIDREVTRRRAQRRGGASASPPPYVAEAEVIAALRDVTPMRRLWNLISAAGLQWDVDGYDHRKAYVLACLSEIAYLHLTEHELTGRDRYKVFASETLDFLLRHDIRFDLGRVLSTLGDMRITVIETKAFVYAVAHVGPFVALAVRGTHTREDVGIDLDALKNPGRYGSFHRGFHEEAWIAKPLLEDAVGDDRPLYFTGHSLGGAVACILRHIWTDEPPPMTPYVYAAPRFGTKGIAGATPRYPHVRPRDFVPHLPPKWMGYSDAGASAISVPLDGVRQSAIATLGRNLVARSFRQFHSIEGYRRLLGEAVGESLPERAYIDPLLGLASATRPAPAPLGSL
jgi:hypothetical protein